jgi:hypothetical protein
VSNIEELPGERERLVTEIAERVRGPAIQAYLREIPHNRVYFETNAARQGAADFVSDERKRLLPLSIEKLRTLATAR